MIDDLLEKLCKDIKSKEAISQTKDKVFIFSFTDDIQIIMKENEGFIDMQSKIATCPELKLEDLFIYLMKANLFLQGTGKNVIGLDKLEKSLTLSANLAYEIKYKNFKEHIEDFINYLIYWRKEIDHYNEKVKESFI